MLHYLMQFFAMGHVRKSGGGMAVAIETFLTMKDVIFAQTSARVFVLTLVLGASNQIRV